jgi:hypothetical protein
VLYRSKVINILLCFTTVSFSSTHDFLTFTMLTLKRTLHHDEYSRLFGGLNGGSSLAPADLDPPVPGKSLWVPQGGACGIAKPGSDVLAKEIIDYWSSHGKGMHLSVCVPGGTCTTALLLQRSLNFMRKQIEERTDIRVVVIPCVGDDEYAMRQMISLDKAVGGQGRKEDLPWILRPRADVEYGSARKRSRGYFTFGQPSKALLTTYDEMNSENVSLDLLYGAPAWSYLLQHWRSRESDCPIAGRQIMYIHTGGKETFLCGAKLLVHTCMCRANNILCRFLLPYTSLQALKEWLVS